MRIFCFFAFAFFLLASSASPQPAPEPGTKDSERVFLTANTMTAQLMAASTAPAEPDKAEYALRWNVNEGGPKTAKETLDVLHQHQEDADNYEVQYFAFTPPKDTPKGVTSILRQRKKGKKKYELTFKYRSEHSLASLGCPLAESPDESKYEVDISIVGQRESKRVYAWSCTIERENDPVTPPPALAAQPMGCTSKMTRLKTNTLKVEEWHLPGDVVMVEVSRNASPSEADLASFQQDVVTVLLHAGVKPSDRSKTEIGSSCPYATRTGSFRDHNAKKAATS
jgi:hypothetical protein